MSGPDDEHDPRGPARPGPDEAAQMQGPGIQIAADEKDLKGRYANLMSVSHTGEEFVLDFFSVTPPGDVPRGALISRIIVSPSHFKRVVSALVDNQRKYEEQFGEIHEPSGMMPSPDDIGFVH